MVESMPRSTARHRRERARRGALRASGGPEFRKYGGAAKHEAVKLKSILVRTSAPPRFRPSGCAQHTPGPHSAGPFSRLRTPSGAEGLRVFDVGNALGLKITFRSDPNSALVLGPWSLVPGPWSLVLGPWSLVLGPWSLGPLVRSQSSVVTKAAARSRRRFRRSPESRGA